MTRRVLTSTLFAAALMAAPLAAQTSDIVIKQYDDGGIYEGTFRNGLQHGTGTYTLPNGYQYSGDWVDGEIRGNGVAHFPNGSSYEGSFVKGKPEGIGKITFADGGTYAGSWLDGKISGQVLRNTQMAHDTKVDFAMQCITGAVS